MMGLHSSRRGSRALPTAAWVVLALGIFALLYAVGLADGLAAQATREVVVGEASSPERGKVDPNLRVALVIGNQAYRRLPLRNAVRDAQDMARLLSELGFKVIAPKGRTAYVNATRDEMNTALNEFRNAIQSAGVALLYFAGHGVEIRGRNYLIPTDNAMRDEDEVLNNGIDLEKELERMDRTAAAVKIVILDACRNNPWARGGGGLASISAAAQGMLIAYATSPGRVAQDGPEGGNGVFTGALIRTLREPGPDLAIEDVFRRTRALVLKDTGGLQLPWEVTSLQGERIVLRAGGEGRTSPEQVAVAAGVARDIGGFAPETRREGTSFSHCARCPAMVTLPAGSFRMGSPPDEPGRHAREGPMFTVTIERAFAVSRHEITFRQWEACVIAGGCRRWFGDEHRARPDHPVVGVTWVEAQEYAEWLSKATGRPYRLLSEAEWEYAARGGHQDGRARPWGDDLGVGQAICAQCGTPEAGRSTTEVARAAYAHPWGLMHMLGNVWEWVGDCFSPNYEGRTERRAAYNGGNRCELRMMRGGAFTTRAHGVRSAARGYFPASRGDINIGFRVATDAVE